MDVPRGGEEEEEDGEHQHFVLCILIGRISLSNFR